MNAFNRFFFETQTEKFFEKSVYLLYPVVIYFLWQHDWKIYHDLAPYFFNSPGLLKTISLPFPSLNGILTLQILGTVACLGMLVFKEFRGFLSLIAALSLFALDYFSNGFGFVNVQIHLVWFCLLFSFALMAKDVSWLRSFIFRFLELIIVLAYVQSGIAKIVTSGLDWGLDGTTLQIAILRQGLTAGSFLAENAHLARIFSVSALIFELSFIFYFFLKASHQKMLLALAITFHLSTWLFMDIGFVHLWVMNLALIVFARSSHK